MRRLKSMAVSISARSLMSSWPGPICSSLDKQSSERPIQRLPPATCARRPSLHCPFGRSGPERPQRLMRVSVSTVRVRYAETDKMGVVYYANYLVWFEVARTDWLRDTGWTYRAMEQEGFGLPVIEAHCDYK